MREIKFRVATKWDDMIVIADVISLDYNMSQNPIGQCVVMLGDWESETQDFDTNCGDTLIQYAGLKDKNVVEIYEGDIVKYVDNKSYLGVIVYKECGLAINWGKDGFFSDKLSLFASKVEIIGNQFENPELLEV